jgi:Fur family peroxide stress response transcriptional regulator
MIENAEPKLDEQLKKFESLCREKGLKVTPQRMAVFRVLLGTKTHPTAEEVWREVRKEIPSISLDTVNRTLNTLLQMGAAFLVEGTGQPKRYDGGLEDHQHFRCLQCGAVIDFQYEPFANIEVPADLKDFTILRKSVYFEGICKRCSEQKEMLKEGRSSVCQ